MPSPLFGPAGSPTASPSSFCNGRYEVERLLGEGGKKRVFLAHDCLLDRKVAFALIKTDALDDVARERIRREAQAMGRLGAHPNIVSVFDLGEHEGQPFIVTELMDGGDVEGLIEKAEHHRVPPSDVLRIGDQICRALEFAHERGIVHRDLKPGNVWLTADGTAKIGDFGLAIALDRSRLTQVGLMVGTVSYMPPEQAIGGEVDPRSDLYSLGATLYELVTGRPPFVGDETVAIITQHLNTPPIAPGWHVPDVPPALEALILRLLEKDPAKRPASAAEVQGALGQIRPWGQGATADKAPDPQAALSSPQPSGTSPFYRSIFVGREQELRQVEDAFDRALSGQGALVTVVGEPGIGKTALSEQLATYVAVRGGKTLVGHCYEEGSLSIPYLAFVEALRTYVLDRDPEGLKKDLGSGAQDVARIVSEIRERISLSQDSALSPQHSPDPDEERWRLFQAVVGFLRNAATVQPILLVTEDLHWADRGTLDLLVHLARNLQGSRLLVIATYRDVEVDRAHPLSGTLAELRRVGSFGRVLLRGLTADEVLRMMGGITGQEVRWAFAEAVHRQTEGNPLFVQEVLRYLVEEGLIVHEGGQWRRAGQAPPEMHIPEGLRDVIGKRLSQLSPDCNRVLSVAAVVGREFSLETLRRVADLGEDDLVVALEEARRVAVLEEQTRPGMIRYRFGHAFFRQTLYEELSAPRRLRLHQHVARALEAQYGSRIEDHAAELAEHFSQSTDADDLRKAVEYGELGARRAVSVCAYGEAARLLDQAIEVQEVVAPDEQARRCDLLLALGQALGPAGEPQRVSDEVAPAAFALAEALGDWDRASRACALALDALHRYGGNLAYGTDAYRQWVERADRYAAPGTRARVLADGARAALPVERGTAADESRTLASKAFALAQDLNDPETLYWAASLVLRPFWAAEQEQRRAALNVTTRPRHGVSARTLVAVLLPAQIIYLSAGNRERAEAVWDEIEDLAARSQDADLLLWPLLIGGLKATLDGRLEEVLGIAEQVIKRGEEVGAPVAGRGFGSAIALWPRLHLGRAEEALAALGHQEGPRGPRRVLALAHAGRRDEALELLSRIEDTAMPLGEMSPEWLCHDLEAAVMLGDHGRAARLADSLDGIVAIRAIDRIRLSNVARHLGGAHALAGNREAALANYGRGLEWATKIRHRPEIALTRLAIAELLLDGEPGLRAEAQAHLDFAIEEFRSMKMRPDLERALRHKGLLHA